MTTRAIEEHQFELLVASVKDYAIVMLDPEGHVTSWNAGAQQIKGYRADEVIGKHMSIFYPPEDVARGRPRALLDAALAQGRVEDEGWRLRKDGSRFWADVVITALRDSNGTLRGFGKVTRDLTARSDAEENRSSTATARGAGLGLADRREGRPEDRPGHAGRRSPGPPDRGAARRLSHRNRTPDTQFGVLRSGRARGEVVERLGESASHPGIPEDQLPRIFERFERAVSTRHYGGMGLGLYVARQIAQAHGGTIAGADLPDGGARFTVRLPLVPPASRTLQ
jgi:PAS domain S-box-containing protein